MFKNSLSPTKSLLVLVLACSLIINLASCANSYSEELKHVEELQEVLEANKANLKLDAPLFKLRVEHIESTLRTFTNDYKETMSKELGDNLSKYKNCKKIYARSIKNYDESVKEQEALEVQLSKLKAGLKAGEMSKDEFKTYYRTEKTDVEQLISKSKEVSKRVYEIEPEYTRLTEYFQPIVAKIELQED